MRSSTVSCRQKINNVYFSAFRLVALTGILLLSGICNASAQTLFTYGKHAVSKDEFLRAYNKNYSDTAAARVTYEEYLDLYARFKLKVQAALDALMDTTAEKKAEV